MGYVIAFFSFFAMVYSFHDIYEIKKEYDNKLKSLEIGKEVIILSGYFSGKKGIVSEYIPYSVKHADFFTKVYQPEGLNVFIDGQVYFFKPQQLELVK